MNLVDQIVAWVERGPAIRGIRLVGSRADESATEFSDWDFRVEANDFAAAAEALPYLLAPLQPLAQQWDRLSPKWCWMLIVRGPSKVDLIFTDERHTSEPPWQPDPGNLEAIDAHFWDWMLWLRSKKARGKSELVASELVKLFDHLLRPWGVKRPSSSIVDAIANYRHARGHAEQQFGIVVGRDLEAAVTPALVNRVADEGKLELVRVPSGARGAECGASRGRARARNVRSAAVPCGAFVLAPRRPHDARERPTMGVSASRSGAGVEPTQRGVTTPHRF
jgi:hypothetical protein